MYKTPSLSQYSADGSSSHQISNMLCSFWLWGFCFLLSSILQCQFSFSSPNLPLITFFNVELKLSVFHKASSVNSVHSDNSLSSDTLPLPLIQHSFCHLHVHLNVLSSQLNSNILKGRDSHNNQLAINVTCQWK